MPNWGAQFLSWARRRGCSNCISKPRVDVLQTKDMISPVRELPATIIKVRQHAEPEEQAGQSFQVGLKPFLLCLKITGLHHILCNGTRRQEVVCRLGVVYRIFVPVLLLFNFLFSTGEYMHVTTFDGILLNNIITSAWFLQVLIFVLNNYFRSWKWDQFYTHWNEYKGSYKLETKNVRTIGIVAVVCYSVWLAAAFAFLGFSLSVPRLPSGFWVYIPEHYLNFVSALTILAYFYFVTSWFLLTTQFIVTGIILCRLFQDLYQNVRRCLETKETFSQKVEILRQRHDKICAMTSEADDILSVFIMAAVGTTIPLIVLTLYYVLFISTDHAFSLVATWWSITLGTIQLTVVFIIGGAVNYMAHKPTNVIHQVDLTNFEQNNIAQLSVFLNRLSSQPIGLTAYGLFVLDKPTIITFVGSIVTYAIVMIQFNPGQSSCPLVTCNCTSVQ